MTGRWVDRGYGAGWRLVRALPEPVARAGFRLAADLAYRRRGPAVRRLAANLRRVVGPGTPEAELSRLVKAGMRSYARYWREAFRLPARTPAQRAVDFRLAGEERLAAAMAEGRGVVLAVPHAGNWDAAGAWGVTRGWPITTVAERLRPEELFQRFVAFRESLGIRVIPLRGGARPPLGVLEEHLRAGHLVPLVADRDLSTRGVEVRFFGGRTRMPAGPALLAMRTGAPLYVVWMWYERDAACGELRGPLAPPADGPVDQRVRELTQRMADELAAGIAAHPADWHMLQRLWLDPVPEPVSGAA